ncbi:DUF1493 family protein [Spirosoma sp. BT702]|uniref:DUF1493 family protein n=1 Tax=Spirosoma profusum TaxID=2771354 RepID=A0A927AVU6_9BACT|nr:DUF1493 family protein [Spirosoma profusum]MBD2705316.1 DUF1493 family protein [Spirosoma profusum]
MDNLERLTVLLEKHGVNRSKIKLTSTIQSFGFGPDEIDDFFDEFGETFHIDGKNYNYYDYFFEMVHPIYMIKDVYNRVFYPSKIKKLEITIDHLLRVIESGEWFKPIQQ